MERMFMTRVTAGLAALLVAGCVAPGGRPASPPAGLQSRRPASVEAATGRGDRAALPPAVAGGDLSLEAALAAALLRNPDLAACAYDMRAAEARRLQAGAWPNPALEFEVGEYDRGGEGFDSAETAVVLAQAFEGGGKRRWRKRVAAAEGELAGWDYESRRLDILAETARRFVGVLAAQERVALAGAAVERAQQTSRAVGERVKAGREPPLQASKAEAELEVARLDAVAAQNARGVARTRLAVMWGGEAAAFAAAVGRLDAVPDAIPSLAALRSTLGANPDLARWDAEVRLRRAALAAEKAARVPDLEASVGYLQFEEDGTDALAFRVGVPLPLFDRNRGNITAARHALAKAESERSAVELGLAAALAEAHADLSAAHQRVGLLRTRVVPAMAQAYEAAHEGYRQGKFGFLDMLDAQRGLLEARASLTEALAECQAGLISIHRLTATGMGERKSEDSENQR